MAGSKAANRDPKPAVPAFDRAVRLLASRRQTTVELRRKLAQRGYGGEEIDRALARLAELRYVDDKTAALDWAEELARNGGLGKQKAIQKLIGRGIEPEQARRALDSAWDDELERFHAREVLKRLLRSSPDLPATAKGRAKLGRSLLSRGFHGEIVHELLRSLPGTRDEDFA